MYTHPVSLWYKISLPIVTLNKSYEGDKVCDTQDNSPPPVECPLLSSPHGSFTPPLIPPPLRLINSCFQGP
jgi:hypothetical protein